MSELESQLKTDNRIGIVIDGEACEIHSVFAVLFAVLSLEYLMCGNDFLQECPF